MQADPFSWVIPAAGQAYRNREEIGNVWKRVINRLLGKHSQLAVTGMAGAGKTVLLDHLSGKAFGSDYKPPGESAAVERETLRRTGKRLGLAVVPGQAQAPNRHTGLQSLFQGRKAVRGVLHVVSFGYTETRSAFARDEIAARGLEEFREARLTEELEDLAATCAVIRSSWVKHKEPMWLIVAVNKVDLYCDEQALAAAESRYSEHHDSPFTEMLHKLVAEIGQINLIWQAMPVCSWLEPFSLGDHRVESKLDMTQRNTLLAKLEDAVAARCESAKDK